MVHYKWCTISVLKRAKSLLVIEVKETTSRFQLFPDVICIILLGDLTHIMR